MRKSIYILIFILSWSCGKVKDSTSSFAFPQDTTGRVDFPLITLDYNINVYANSGLSYTGQTVTRGRREAPLHGLIRVDGHTYRFLGTETVKDRIIAGMSEDTEWSGKYSLRLPAAGWADPDYDDSQWLTGEAPFGDIFRNVNTIWPSRAIWVRRKIKINPKKLQGKKLYLKYSHDDVCEIHINGIPIVKTGFEWHDNVVAEIPENITDTFSDGEISIAVYCQNLAGGCYLDFGIYAEESGKPEHWQGKYTLKEPPKGWEAPGFNDTKWQTGKAPFGTSPGYDVNTKWETDNIWVRKEFIIDEEDLSRTLLLKYSHDDILELYANGIKIISTGYEWKFDLQTELPDTVMKTITDGKLLIAAHCQNKEMGAFLDFSVSAHDIAKQKSVICYPGRTEYIYECAGVELTVNYESTHFTKDASVMSWPLNYVTFQTRSVDGQEHDVQIYFEASHLVYSDEPLMNNTITESSYKNISYMSLGKREQTPLFKPDWRENNIIPMHEGCYWGYFYLASDNAKTECRSGQSSDLREHFVQNGTAVSHSDTLYSEVMSTTVDMGNEISGEGRILMAYDDIHPIQFMGKNLTHAWKNKQIKDIPSLLYMGSLAYDEITTSNRKAEKPFLELYGSQTPYMALTFREAISGYKFCMDDNNDLLLFSVIWNSDRRLEFRRMLGNLDIKLLKAWFEPYLHYMGSNKWYKNFPPVDMGDLPLSNGQTKDWDDPISTTSNMLRLMAYIAEKDGNADFAAPHIEMMKKWHDHLITEQYDLYLRLLKQFLSDGEFEWHDDINIIAEGIGAYRGIEQRLGNRK